MSPQRLYNPFVIALLRSPLHRLLGRSVMLINVRGRRSGRHYTTPVGYVRDGDDLLVLSWRRRTWWRNLRGGAPVRLRLDGRMNAAAATVDENPERVAANLERLATCSPRLGRRLGIRLGPDGRPLDPTALRALVARAVIVRVSLASGPARDSPTP
jgi:deazaflavin-dependent oxidoreductase (nitroreductase family)